MSASWAGPWVQAVDAHGSSTPLPDSSWRGARLHLPAGTVKVIVRWREPGWTNPRKRTLPANQPAAVLDLAHQIAVAKLLRSSPQGPSGPADLTADGRIHTDQRQFAQQQHNNLGSCQNSPQDQGMTTSQPVPTSTPGQAGSAAPQPFSLPDQRGSSTHASSCSTGTTSPTDVQQPAVPGGPTVAEFVITLLEEYGPVWAQNNDVSTPLQIELAARMFLYRDGDPLLAQYPGLHVGGSLHLSVATRAHCAEALKHRRGVNYQAQRLNEVQQAKYEDKLAAYQIKIAAYDAATGRRGKRPSPPSPPVPKVAALNIEQAAVAPLIQPRTEQMFVRAGAFIFDRADDYDLLPQDNVHLAWRRPRQRGAQQGRTKPFREPSRTPAAGRTFPGLGMFIDLGDAMAERGRLVEDDAGRLCRTGERYRYLPLIATIRALRPYEGRVARPEHSDGTHHTVIPEVDSRLKMRPLGEVRQVPMSALDTGLQAQHVEAGFCSDDGRLFSSPNGRPLDSSNFKDDFLGPAMNLLLSPGGLWADAGLALGQQDRDWYLMRKSGVSIWLAHGLEPSLAAKYAGHDEATQLKVYKGLIQGARSRVWSDMSACVEQALAEHPPRGDGHLATLIRAWLGLSAD